MKSFFIKNTLKSKLGGNAHSVSKARKASLGWLPVNDFLKIQFDWNNNQMHMIDHEGTAQYRMTEYVGNAKMEQGGIINDMWRIEVVDSQPGGWEYIVLNFTSSGETWLMLKSDRVNEDEHISLLLDNAFIKY